MDNTISIRHTEPHEKDEFAYSHSIVEAILTCPVWGIIRYVKRKYYAHTNRQMALEAGGAMHDVFAAVRLWQVYRKQGLEQHWLYHGARLFGEERFEAAFQPFPDHPRDELINFCYNILNSGEFYDDPGDSTRTLSNMEETIIRYVDERLQVMEKNPIWIADPDDPMAPIGIEQVLDVMVTFRGRTIRYIGTLDGLIDRGENRVRVEENKTASRLDETWRRSFEVKTQPTGYILLARLLTGRDCGDVRVIGCKVKQSRSAEDYLTFVEEKDEHHFFDWAKTTFHAAEMVERFQDEPLEAPKFTHSCSRYFRSCAFIDLCAAEPADQLSIYGGMVEAELTPSQKAVQGL